MRIVFYFWIESGMPTKSVVLGNRVDRKLIEIIKKLE
jgi:hypothetical protein